MILMKKIFFLVILFIILTGLIFIIKIIPDKQSFNLPAESEIVQTDPIQKVDQPENSKEYKSVWIKVNDKDKLTLFTNLDNKLPSKELATKYSCLHLVSGGFYDTENNHIGLLVSEGNIISQSQENNLFNAYFSISKTGVVSITEYPVFSPRISLQTGPYLLKNGENAELKLEKDENARRLALGIDKDKNIYFIAVYEQKNLFLGPKLVDLPKIIEQLNTEKKLTLVDVINLDGGAHSAFISSVVSLSEASPIGSFFCIKP